MDLKCCLTTHCYTTIFIQCGRPPSSAPIAQKHIVVLIWHTLIRSHWSKDSLTFTSSSTFITFLILAKGNGWFLKSCSKLAISVSRTTLWLFWLLLPPWNENGGIDTDGVEWSTIIGYWWMCGCICCNCISVLHVRTRSWDYYGTLMYHLYGYLRQFGNSYTWIWILRSNIIHL